MEVGVIRAAFRTSVTLAVTSGTEGPVTTANRAPSRVAVAITLTVIHARPNSVIPKTKSRRIGRRRHLITWPSALGPFHMGHWAPLPSRHAERPRPGREADVGTVLSGIDLQIEACSFARVVGRPRPFEVVDHRHNTARIRDGGDEDGEGGRAAPDWPLTEASQVPGAGTLARVQKMEQSWRQYRLAPRTEPQPPPTACTIRLSRMVGMSPGWEYAASEDP
jgi:hypothetical protein